MEIDYLGVALRWLHILAGGTALGGAIFARFAFLPAAREVPAERRGELLDATRRRWARVVHLAIGLLLVSGLYSIMMMIRDYRLASPYHMLFGIKFLVAFAVFGLASMLSGRSAGAQKIQQNASFWLSVNIGLIVLIVLISSVLRALPHTPKQVPERTTIGQAIEGNVGQGGRAVDKKAKHKTDVLRQRLQKLRLQLAGARQQMDEPDEVRRIEQEIKAAEAEIEKLKAEG